MHRRPPNLVKNFAVSLVFQPRLAGRTETRRDIGRGEERRGKKEGRKEGRKEELDDTTAPLTPLSTTRLLQFLRCLHSAGVGETIFKFSGSSLADVDAKLSARLAREPCVTNFSPLSISPSPHRHSWRVCLLLHAKEYIYRVSQN